MSIYYVRTDGNDSHTGLAADSAHAWLTIAKATSVMVAGDTVNIEAGTYAERISAGANGSAGNYITYQNYNTDVVNINGAGQYTAVRADGHSYIKFKGLNVVGNGSTYMCINFGNADHITIQNCTATTCNASGIGNDGTEGATSNITIDGCTVSGTNVTANMEMISLSKVNGFEVKNCTVHDPISAIRVGIDAKEGSSNGSIHNNTVYNTNSAGIYVDAASYATSSIDIYDNLVYSTAGAPGISIADELNSSSLTNINIYNNILYGNQRGITIESYGTTSTFTNCTIINNTLYNNGTISEVACYVGHAQLTSCVIRNNIIFSLTGNTYSILYADYASGGITIDHNLAYNSGGSWHSGNVLGTSYVTSNPLLTSPTTDFSIQSSSPAKDAGSSTNAPSTDYIGNTRPIGVGYDIGAYEFNSGITTGLPVITCRIAFANNALDASPTWTDVSADVMSFEINRGRTYEMNRMEAGTTTVTLKNISGNYWTYNAGGAYYPNIAPVKLINIRATWNGTTYDLFYGYIEAWKPDWLLDGMRVPTMVLTCSDLTKNLSRFLLNNAGYSSETSGVRVGHVLDSIGWPAGTRTIATGQSTLQATGTLTNTNAMTHIYGVLDSEAGQFYIAANGYATFEDRLTRSILTSQATFTDAKGYPSYVRPSISYDDQFIYNDIRRTRTGGTEQVADDPTSNIYYGLRSFQQGSLLNNTDTDVAAGCVFYLSKFKSPLLRVDSLEILPSAKPATLYPYVLGFDLSTRITMVVGQASINEDYFIEGIHHRWDAQQPQMWQTTWQLSNCSKVKYPALLQTNLTPNAAGDNTGLSVSGTTTNFTAVQTVGSGKYVYWDDYADPIRYDLYNLTDISTVGFVQCVTVYSHMSSLSYFDGAVPSITNLLSVGTTRYSGIHTCTTGSLWYSDIFQVGVKTASTINSMQAGVQITVTESSIFTANFPDIDCVYVTVNDYQPY